MSTVHATALVDTATELADSVSIGPYSVIGPGVQIGAGTRIGAHCVIEGPTRIGCDNVIHSHAALGGAPQDMKYRGEPTELHIGDRNTIFQFTTFSRGTVQGGGVTRVGDDNWIMAYVHLAHDVQLGSHTVLANNATLAGHVHVGDWAIVGGLTGIHQFCKVGAHSFLANNVAITRDVPPYLLVAGTPAEPKGVNSEGLKRRGFSPEQIANIRNAYRLLYRSGLKLAAATEQLQALAADQPELLPFVQFLAASERSIVR